MFYFVFNLEIDILTLTVDLFFIELGLSKLLSNIPLLLQATSLLVNAIKGDAEGVGEGDSQKRLLGAAKQLADATAKMVEAAKVGLDSRAWQLGWALCS